MPNIEKIHPELWTPHDVPYFSSFIAKSCLNDLEDIGQGQRSLCTTHPLMLVILCLIWKDLVDIGQGKKDGKNPSRTLGVTEWTRNAGQTDEQTEGRSE